jgi:hypothetical protein
MLPTKFRFIWQSGFRGEDFFKSANQKQELPMAAMFVNGSGQNEQFFERTFHRCFLPRFTSFGWVQRRRLKCEKLTDDRRRTPSDGKSSHCLWQGELITRGSQEPVIAHLDQSCFQSQRNCTVADILVAAGHNFGRGLSNDYSIKVWF